jgi:micrococcal nuclease
VATGRVAGTISRVVDGDTIDVTFGGRTARVRLIGMDTPETKHPSKPVMCFGAEATVKTQQLIDQVHGQVFLEKDISETDQYSRLLRYVWLPLPGGEVMLNEVLVEQGYAQVSTYPPDVKYQDRFLAAQRVAREQNRGLWAACGSFGVAAASPTVAAARVPATATSAPVVRALPTAPAKPAARVRPTATVAPTAPVSASGAGQSGSGPIISSIYYDGQEYRSEGDEYAVIKNPTNKPIDLRGYTLNAGDPGQDFTFPAFTLKPNATVRVYTNRNIAGSFSFDSGRALWNNKGDCGYLYDPRGKQVSDYCY